MDLVNAWIDLRIVHLSHHAEDFATARPGPTPLAPWHTWHAGRYLPCGTPQGLASVLDADPAPTLLLAHEEDLEDALASNARLLTDWLDPDGASAHPRRLVIVYAGRLVHWGNCASFDIETLARGLGPSARADRCAAMPWKVLVGPLRPLAWLGHIVFDGPAQRLPLARIGDDDAWLRDFGHRYLDLPKRGEPTPERLWCAAREDVLNPLLHGDRHGLGSAGTAPHDRRAARLLQAADLLWLLHGLARRTPHGRPLVDRLRRLLDRLHTFLSTPLLDLSPAGFESWQDTRRALEDLTDSPL